jgi:hypothetical protein
VLKFPTDYERENPVTKNDAAVKMIERRIKQAKTSEEQVRLMNEKNQIANASVFDAIRHYQNRKDAQTIAMSQQTGAINAAVTNQFMGYAAGNALMSRQMLHQRTLVYRNPAQPAYGYPGYQ